MTEREKLVLESVAESIMEEVMSLSFDAEEIIEDAVLGLFSSDREDFDEMLAFVSEYIQEVHQYG